MATSGGVSGGVKPETFFRELIAGSKGASIALQEMILSRDVSSRDVASALVFLNEMDVRGDEISDMFTRLCGNDIVAFVAMSKKRDYVLGNDHLPIMVSIGEFRNNGKVPSYF